MDLNDINQLIWSASPNEASKDIASYVTDIVKRPLSIVELETISTKTSYWFEMGKQQGVLKTQQRVEEFAAEACKRIAAVEIERRMESPHR